MRLGLGLGFSSVSQGTPPVAADTVLLFVAGQSNSRKSNTSALTGPARYASLGTVNIWDPVAVNWVAYTTTNPATRTCGHRAGTGGTPDRAWGTEAEFIYRMRLAGDNRPVYIIKEAVNGMSMAVDWQPGAPGGNRWVGLKGQIDAARPTLSAFVLAEATLWNQGEADANDAPSTDAFDVNFDNFMDNWRTQISPSGRFIAERLRPLGYELGSILNTPAALARSYQVREDMAARLIADGNFEIVAADWYQANWDDLHPSDTYADPVSGTIDLWISGLQTQVTVADHGIGQRAYAAFTGAHDATYGDLTNAVPAAFSFADVGSASAGVTVSSDTITPVFERRTTISITGDTGFQYRIRNWDDSLAVDWTATAGTIDPLQKVDVRVTSGPSVDDVRSVTLTIGGVSDTFSVTTAAVVDYLAETDNYLAALVAENGSDPWDATKKAALDDFFDTAKNGATPFLTEIKSLYVGGKDPNAAALIDLKRSGTGGVGYSKLVQSGASGMPSWTDNAGWSNGANSGYGATFGLNPSTELTQDSIGIGGYFTTRQTTSSSVPDILDQNTTAANVRLQLLIFDAGASTTINYRLNNGATGNITGLADTDGFYHANRSAAGATQLYGPAGTEIQNATTASTGNTATGVYHGRATTGLTTNAILGAQWITTSMTAGQVQAFRDALVTLLAVFD